MPTAQKKRRVVDVVDRPDGTRLVHAVEGRGTPVLLLHGFGTHRGIWDAVLAELDGAVEAHTIDLRGHGASSALAERTPIDVFADDVAGVLDTLDLRDVVLVGHSLGGMVVQAACHRHPDVVRDRLRSLLLVNTSADPLSSRATRAVGSYFQSRLPDLVRSSWHLNRAVSRMSFPSAVPGHVVDAWASVSPPALQSRRHFDISSVPDFRSENASLALPVTVLASSKDLAVSVHDSAVLADSFPDSRLRLVPRTGHMLPMERPEAVAAELRRLAR